MSNALDGLIDRLDETVNRDSAVAVTVRTDDLRAVIAELRRVRDDTARLDALERLVDEGEGLRIHNGNFHGNHSGLGLRNTGRTLRKALDDARIVPTGGEG